MGDQPLRLAIGQRAQQDGVSNAEHSGARADAESQRHDGEYGEARRPAKRARGVLQIPARIVEQPVRARIAVKLLRLLDAAEPESRSPPSVFSGHASTPVLIFHEREVSVHFSRELGLRPFRTERVKHSEEETPNHASVRPSD